MNIEQLTKSDYNKSVSQCSNEEIYLSLLKEINLKKATEKSLENEKKKLYYISAEFLIGKLLSNNLINSGVYEDVKKQLSECGKSISEIEEIENEPSLGNGGLGRLASCFLDSVATLNLNGDGIGLNYHFGLFRQVFKNNSQTAQPDRWITDNSWLCKTDVTYKIKLADKIVDARMYDINIIGYMGRTNKLHLFDIESVDESIVQDGISFDKTDVEKNLTLFLYPDDSDENGKLLRIFQQYFMVSCAARFILDEVLNKGCKLYDLSDYAVIQINDTHPTMIILELIRLFCERGMAVDDAISAVSKSCAYTNHTILAEALEKWPIEYLKRAVPQLVPIIEILDDKVRRKFNDKQLYIIDENEQVHMANIDIHCCFSVNGVASLHTDILKEYELLDFYKIYPDKFNNKTNGITFRRWLLHANPELTNLITSLIGDDFKTDAQNLKKLLDFKNDKIVLQQLIDIKKKNKRNLKEYLLKTQNISLNENSIFDIQIKRLHEYKRQQLNVLYLIHKYLEIKEGKFTSTQITAIFGAKAAPAYTIAQDIIHLILCMQQLVMNDDDVNKYLNVFMVENYNVTLAEKLIPACDISQQISLASKEASGTGNMKFMLNGGITLGTEDGANVEIHRLVGDDNIYIFGESSDTVNERYKRGDYVSADYYNKNPELKRAVDFITGESLSKIGDSQKLRRLSDELLKTDWFMTFPDFDDYVKTREKAYLDYDDQLKWAEKMLVNIAMAGYFSSDRAIYEYNRDIWRI